METCNHKIILFSTISIIASTWRIHHRIFLVQGQSPSSQRIWGQPLSSKRLPSQGPTGVQTCTPSQMGSKRQASYWYFLIKRGLSGQLKCLQDQWQHYIVGGNCSLPQAFKPTAGNGQQCLHLFPVFCFFGIKTKWQVSPFCVPFSSFSQAIGWVIIFVTDLLATLLDKFILTCFWCSLLPVLLFSLFLSLFIFPSVNLPYQGLSNCQRALQTRQWLLFYCQYIF